ncbi:MAG: pentapeptide repeat-containing protein [Rhodospirillales bacterium]|nr:pentapeptide repeat-containing protein [Rhodospirillales bacterium]
MIRHPSSCAIVGVALVALYCVASSNAHAQSGTCRITRAAKCEGANLEGRDLRGANLRDANMKGAKLRGANLTGADLGGANFSEADMRFSNLAGAALFGTQFVNTDMTGAGLRFQDIRTDTDLSGAIMPDGKRCSTPSVGDCKNPSAAPPAPQRR